MPEPKTETYVTHNEFLTFAKQNEQRFDQVLTAIEKIRDGRTTNWSVIFSGIVLLGMFITLYVGPIKSDAEHLQGEINQSQAKAIGELVDQAYLNGYTTRSVEVNTQEILRIRARSQQ